MMSDQLPPTLVLIFDEPVLALGFSISSVGFQKKLSEHQVISEWHHLAISEYW